MSYGVYSGAALYMNAGAFQPAAGASIEVRREVDNALATIFSDAAGTPLANPFSADANGNFAFAAAGLALGYKVTVTKDAFTKILRNVQVGTAGELDAATLDLLPAATRPGKTAIPIPASAITPRSANGCAGLAVSNGASNQPDVPYLAFDGAAKEYAGFLLRMPKGWNEGPVTAAFSWRRASGTGAANVVWGIRAVAVADNDTPAANFGSDATVTDAASTTTANFNLSGETGNCTVAGSPGAEELVFFEVFRDGAAGGDTLDAVDAWLSGLTLFITTDAHNDA